MNADAEKEKRQEIHPQISQMTQILVAVLSSLPLLHTWSYLRSSAFMGGCHILPLLLRNFFVKEAGRDCEEMGTAT